MENMSSKCTFVRDRGYDANIIFDYFINHIEYKLIIRLKKTRNQK